MQKTRLAASCCERRVLFSILCFLCSVLVSHAQTPEPYYTRKNSFGVLFQYSNDSSHILLGVAEQRKLLNIGVSYSRRLLLTRFGSWQYDAEVLPVALESDPRAREIITQNTPTQETRVYDNVLLLDVCSTTTTPYSYEFDGVTYSGTFTTFCHGRQWTVGEAMSPFGLRWNFRPNKKLQPVLEAHGGYLYSTHAIPVQSAGAFNFTFDFGAGIELFRSHSRSIRVEYRYHHISNDETATRNPGIDNGVFHIAYVFGR